MAKPRINTRAVASKYAALGETIAEFSHDTGGGGLISMRRTETDPGLVVELYRLDPQVTVRVAYESEDPRVTVTLSREAAALVAAMTDLGTNQPNRKWLRADVAVWREIADAFPIKFWDEWLRNNPSAYTDDKNATGTDAPTCRCGYQSAGWDDLDQHIAAVPDDDPEHHG